MSTILHPKCGQRFPGGSQAGHCAGCCRTFIGLAAFEAHRVGTHTPDTRRCELQPYEAIGENGRTTYGHWQDERGYWHHGKQLSKDEKEEIWGKPEEEQ